MFYFVYNDNLNTQNMQKHCPESKPCFPATLHNYKLIFTGWSRQWHGGTANIRRVNGERVLGAIFEITPECLQLLNRIQNDHWQLLKIIVNDEDGKPREAITHINLKQLEETKPSMKYLAAIKQGYREWAII